MTDCARKMQLSSLLRDVALGTVSSQSALEVISKWIDVDWEEPLFSGAFHALSHFDADTDIRVRNEKYAEAQKKLLRQHALRLEDH